MPRGPDNPGAIFEPYAADMQRVFEDELEAVVVTDDVAMGDYSPSRSTIQFLVSVTDPSFARVRACAPIVARWRRRRVAAPLLTSRGIIQSSIDAYPIEFLNMSLFHQVIWGEHDPLADLVIEREQLRVQCERLTKRSLVMITSAYLETGGELKELGALMTDSIERLAWILRALIHLRGKPVPGPKRKVFKAAGKNLNLSEATFSKVLRFRDEAVQSTKARVEKLFESYVAQLEQVAKIADEL